MLKHILRRAGFHWSFFWKEVFPPNRRERLQKFMKWLIPLSLVGLGTLIRYTVYPHLPAWGGRIYTIIILSLFILFLFYYIEKLRMFYDRMICEKNAVLTAEQDEIAKSVLIIEKSSYVIGCWHELVEIYENQYRNIPDHALSRWAGTLQYAMQDCGMSQKELTELFPYDKDKDKPREDWFPSYMGELKRMIQVERLKQQNAGKAMVAVKSFPYYK